MTGNEVGRWLRALAQPTTYLGVAMLLSIFAGVIYLLVQSRAVEEDEAKRSGANIVRIFAQSISRLLQMPTIRCCSCANSMRAIRTRPALSSGRLGSSIRTTSSFSIR